MQCFAPHHPLIANLCYFGTLVSCIKCWSACDTRTTEIGSAVSRKRSSAAPLSLQPCVNSHPSSFPKMNPRAKQKERRREPRVRTHVWIRDLTYYLTQYMISFMAAVVWRLHVLHKDRWPSKGGALLCANHQSYLDPPLIGASCPGRMNYLARKTLFDHPAIGWVIGWLEAIPLEREGLGIGGIKEALRRLQGGEVVLIFPEGTRSADGELQLLQPGFCALARRGRVPIVPLAIDGPFKVWPRHKKLPGLARITISVGEAISLETIESSTDAELVARVTAGIRSALEEARATLS